MSSDGIEAQEIRNRLSDVLERVQAGEQILITKSGIPVAELHPLKKRALSREEILARWRHIPVVDPIAFRHDIDEAVNSSQ